MSALRARAEAMRPGEQLPTSRALMSELGVGPVTVRRAVARLTSEGLVTTRPGAGTFVAQRHRAPEVDTAWQHVSLGASPVDPGAFDLIHRLGDPLELDLSRGYPDASIRADGRVAAAMARAARRPGAWEPPPAAGLSPLRSWFAGEMGVDVADVLVSPGGQGALSSTLRAIVPSGSPVLFSVPTYPGALAIARSAGLVPVPVPSDEDGVRPELLELALAATGARLVYLQPTYANPNGAVLAASRRRAVLDLAAAAGAFLVEDDFARWLGHGPPPPPPLIGDDRHGSVIAITSLSKAAAPSLRVGAIAARGPVLQRIAGLRTVDDFFVSRALQEAALDLVTGAGWQAHLHALGGALRRRCAALGTSVARHLAGCELKLPSGGLVAWLGLPRHLDDVTVAERAASVGVGLQAGRPYTLGEDSRPHVRLAFGATGESSFDEAMRRLAGIL
ncbi:MAG TPA: PLP-dependent aminotransferase family protein [Acidimicrobiales bacterium]|nr:PLP-dependent aminotransferase family protein [Acidimicrobiales bacterium]